MSKHNSKSERELMVHIADVLDRIEEGLRKTLFKTPQPPRTKQPPKKKDVNTKTVRSSNKE